MDETLFWENGISPVSGTDYYFEQDFNDKNILYLTLKKDFLEGLDGTGKKISPSLTLTEPKSGRDFGSYAVPALVNSAPPAVILPVVLRTGGTAGDETYVICFNLPEMTGIHQDVKTLKIGSPYEKTYTVNTDGTLSGGGTELKTKYDTGWQPVNDAEFVGDKNNRFVGIVTNVLLSGDLTSFTLSLVDEYGLSTSVTASTQASKLPSVTASPTGGIITINGTVEFSNSVPGAILVLESDKWEGVEKEDGTPVSGNIEGAGPITLTFTEPGTYNITAYAQKSGAADSGKVIFTYKVVDDSTVYVSEFGDDNNPGTEDKPVATLQRALDLLNEARFTEGKIVVTGTVQTREVKINAPDGSTTGSVTTLTVMGGSAGGTLKNENGRVFNIASGGSLTLGENITLTGTVTDDNGGAVYVNGGTFTMEADSKITGSSAIYGGGVYVDSTGTFTMGGGTISKNRASSTYSNGDGASGGGVCISDGTFTMSGGAVISGNTAIRSGGGVYIFSDGIFTMKDGSKITGGQAAFGGGVYVADGSFTMSGTATLQGNEATEHGGGVHILSGGNFTMKGGTIGGDDANTAKYGGGVFVSGGTFDMNNGTISGNSASGTGASGGGVCISGGTFTMSDGAFISGNTATSSGGGVFVSARGDFTMNGGTIGGSGGGRLNSAENGGGVYIHNGTFTMSGSAVISGNRASGSSSSSGGGVFVQDGTFTLSGSPNISGNYRFDFDNINNVYLAGAKTISIGDSGLTGGTIGVTAETITSGGAVQITDKDVTGADGIFTSDDPDYSIVKYNGAVYLSDAETKYVAGADSTENLGLFKDALDAVNGSGGTITLLKDIYGSNAVFGTGSANNQPITFEGSSESTSFILDLNGKIIDRGLSPAATDGSVIKIDGGALTIRDSSATDPDGTNGTGTITGGNSVESGGGIRMGIDSFLTLESGNIIGNFVTGAYGGGVYVTTGCTFTMEGGNIASNQTGQSNGQGGGVGGASDGIFIINGGIITGNTAGKGGGVSIGNYGTFTMSGGTISGNTAYQNGGGVYVSSTGNFTLGSLSAESSPVISGNIKTGNSTNNVYLDNGKTLSITGKLIKTKEPGNIGIFMATPGVFTFNWSKSDLADTAFFFSDEGSYKIGIDSSGECKLVNNDSEVEYKVSGSTSSGTFADALAAVNGSGGTITLLKDIDDTSTVFGAGSANNQPITFSSDDETRSFILDLNGKTINRGLSTPTADGSVIKIEGGTLTIKDSSAAPDGTGGTGTITGGNSTTNGGGIFIENNGSLTLESGSITGNKTGADGGGVYFSSNGTFTMSGGSIKSNVASNGIGGSNGGGVFLNGGTFTMSGTATIADNKAVSGTSKGGGIYLDGGTLTMTGDDAAITGNQASAENAHGGGIYLNSGTFNMIDGEITDNKAGRGGGVYFPSKADGGLIFYLGDSDDPDGTDPVIRNNTKNSGDTNNVYVESEALIEIVGVLRQNGETEIGISKQENKGDFAKKNEHDVSVSIFSSDQDGYRVDEYDGKFNISQRQ